MLVANLPHAPAAVRVDLGAIFVSMELSRSTWLVTSLSPGSGERMLDGEALVRALGEPRVCAMVRPPSVAQEDRRRLSRERKVLVSERTQHVNRIKGLLFSQGITGYQPLRRDRRDQIKDLRTGDGRTLAPLCKLRSVGSWTGSNWSWRRSRQSISRQRSVNLPLTRLRSPLYLRSGGGNCTMGELISLEVLDWARDLAVIQRLFAEDVIAVLSETSPAVIRPMFRIGSEVSVAE
jgi:hypothetical protein